MFLWTKDCLTPTSDQIIGPKVCNHCAFSLFLDSNLDKQLQYPDICIYNYIYIYTIIYCIYNYYSPWFYHNWTSSIVFSGGQQGNSTASPTASRQRRVLRGARTTAATSCRLRGGWWSLGPSPSLKLGTNCWCLPSGELTVCNGKWQFIVDFPIKNGDFPLLF